MTSVPAAALKPPIIGSGMKRITREAPTMPKAMSSTPVSAVASVIIVIIVGTRASGVSAAIVCAAMSTRTAVGVVIGTGDRRRKLPVAREHEAADADRDERGEDADTESRAEIAREDQRRERDGICERKRDGNESIERSHLQGQPATSTWR